MMLRKLFVSSALALTVTAGMMMPAMAADDHIINMQDVDIKAFIENVGIVTGRTFVIDPRVNGKVNIVSEKPLNDAQVLLSSRKFCACMAILSSARLMVNTA